MSAESDWSSIEPNSYPRRYRLTGSAGDGSGWLIVAYPRADSTRKGRPSTKRQDSTILSAQKTLLIDKQETLGSLAYRVNAIWEW